MPDNIAKLAEKMLVYMLWLTLVFSSFLDPRDRKTGLQGVMDHHHVRYC